MRLALTALLAALAAGPALAQQISPMTGTTAGPPTTAPSAAPATTAPAAAPARRTRQTMQQRFDAANTTHDGKLTLDQAKAGHMPQVAKDFDAIDTAKKGYVTMDDIRAHNRARRAANKTAK